MFRHSRLLESLVAVLKDVHVVGLLVKPLLHDPRSAGDSLQLICHRFRFGAHAVQGVFQFRALYAHDVRMERYMLHLPLGMLH